MTDFEIPQITLSPLADLLKSTGTEWGSTRYAELQRCGEAYDLRYRQKLLPVYRPSYFGVGSLVHAGIRCAEEGAALGIARDWRLPIIEARRLAEQRPEAKLSLLEEDEEFPTQGEAFGLDEIWEAERLLGAYFACWGEENAGWPIHFKIVGIEVNLRSEAFSLPLTGAIDTLLQNQETGQLIIVDTKTAASRVPVDEEKRSEWRKGRAVRPQFLMLSFLLREALSLDYEPGFIVNHLSKAKAPVAERVPLEIGTGALEAWSRNQLQVALASDWHDSEFMPPVRNYSACAPAFGGKCQYFDYCHGSEISRKTKFAIAETLEEESSKEDV